MSGNLLNGITSMTIHKIVSVTSCVIVLLALSTFSAAQSAPAPTSPETPRSTGGLPYRPSLDVSAMDNTIDPCVDFYEYSCGGWKKANPIPPDRTSWGRYGQLYEDNLVLLRSILKRAAAAKDRDAVDQKIGDFYGSCVDEAAVNRLGFTPIKQQLESIASIKSKADFAIVVAHLQFEDLGGEILFGPGSFQDPDNSDQQIAAIDQGGLGLPDRDYYTKDDAKAKENRERFVQHVQKIFALMGDTAAQAKANAETVMRIEMALAKASQTRTDRRDPYKIVHKMAPAQQAALTPNWDWNAYWKALNPPPFQVVNVLSPDFMKQLNTTLAAESVDNWKNYLRFHIANINAPYMSEEFATAHFDFYQKYLRGAQEQEPRWKRCVEFIDRGLGEALGQAYVRAVFSPELKASTLKMVEEIEKAMELRINQLDWMSPTTKQQALTKLHSIRNKIGYPDKWRDYSSVDIKPDNFAANVRNATVFEARRQLNKIGSPTDRGEWQITPPTVDAYYNPQVNDINFPAGVLQPPLYDAKMDDAPNYGDTGGTIGHELTHAFDDEGSQFDGKGNLKNWWTPDDQKKFEERTQCVDDQYSQYVAVDDIRLNGKLTLGENVADLGGEILAYMAWEDATKDMKLETKDGLTPEQRFFVGFAQWDCANERPEQVREWVVTNPHSTAKYRINGVVVNMSQFAEAFSCKKGQPMVGPKVCKVW
jgi:endothelin-converting enzyme/putative endopeptidase